MEEGTVLMEQGTVLIDDDVEESPVRLVSEVTASLVDDDDAVEPIDWFVEDVTAEVM